MITAYVKGQDLQIAQPLTVADTIDYLEMRFCFQTADWDGADKWAHFRQRENIYDINLVDDKITADKHLNLSEGKWEVYLHGTKGNARITTDIEFINVIGTGTLNGEPLPDIPLSAAEQISAKADNAEKIAQSVRDDADAGKFKGDKGDKGEQGEEGEKGDTGIAGKDGVFYFPEFIINKNGDLMVEGLTDTSNIKFAINGNDLEVTING